MRDTIFALSSGAPPAAIGVIRISGPRAGEALTALCGDLPEPRRASLRDVRGEGGSVLDSALVLWFPGDRTATGEDLAELHCHGGRAVVAAVEERLSEMEGLRQALPGEFTRRAFANGRIDLAEAEGLADLLGAETELQRRSAMALSGGTMSRQVERWREEVLRLSAIVEGVLDFSDEDDTAALPDEFVSALRALADEIGSWLAKPRAERLKEGVRVVLAGPPNSGKSTLFNALLEDDAAIVSPIEGTTRDLIERPVSLNGAPFVFVDTAGLREQAGEEIEAEGISRARRQLEKADIVLWLGPEGEGPDGAIELDAKIDTPDLAPKVSPELRLSAETGQGVDDLVALLVARARDILPKPGDIAINARQAECLEAAELSLRRAAGRPDDLLIAEDLREVRAALDRLTGRAATEDMLDALFGRFCIGK